MDVQTHLSDFHPNYSGSQDVFFSDLLSQFADGQLQAKLADAKESGESDMIEMYERDIACVMDAINDVRKMTDEQLAELIDAKLTLKLLAECEEEED
jgi:hypothetical protein